VKLTGEELVQVIKSCKEASATRFKGGGVEIHFAPMDSDGFRATDVLYDNYDSPLASKSEETEEAPLPIEEDDMLTVTDPEAWEEAQLDKI